MRGNFKFRNDRQAHSVRALLIDGGDRRACNHRDHCGSVFTPASASRRESIPCLASERTASSNPIALSADHKLDFRSQAEVAEISVGNEPQGVALTPDNKYAYIAYRAMTVINIKNPKPTMFKAVVSHPPQVG